MTRVARFLALSRAERAILVQALLWLPVTSASLRLRGLPRRAPASLSRPRPSVSPARVAKLVGIASRYGLVRGNCLSRSLTLQRLLRRNGVASELRIGVRRAGAALEAHAWVELDGRPLNDSADVAQHYAPFEGLASALPPLA